MKWIDTHSSVVYIIIMNEMIPRMSDVELEVPTPCLDYFEHDNRTILLVDEQKVEDSLLKFFHLILKA